MTNFALCGKRAVFAAILLFLLVPSQTWAHGSGKPQLNKANAGAFQITVWTSPDPARVGDLHVAVVVNDAPASDSTSPIEIQVTLTPTDASRAPMTASAERQESFLQIYYESYFALPATGQWQVAVTVSKGTNRGTAGFALEIFEKQQIPQSLIFGGILLFLALLAMARVLGIIPSLHPQSSPERRFAE